VAEVEEVRERRQCHLRAATESPKVGQSRIREVEVQPDGVWDVSRAAKGWLTSTLEKRAAQRRWWEVESEAITDRAE